MAGRRVPLGRSVGAWSFSPNRRQLAIGVDRVLGVRIVDVRKMRTVGDVQTPNGNVLAIAWLAPRRIVGIDRAGLFVVDPVAKRLVRSRLLQGTLLGWDRTASALVLLFGPPAEGSPVASVGEWGGTVGPARLDVISTDGGVRSLRLDRIRSGAEIDGTGTAHDRWIPGFALDRAGGHAFVVGGDGVIAQVDLRSLAVTYHEPGQHVSLLGRALGWLQPAASAKGPIAGPARHAAWVGNGMLAVSGADVHVTVQPHDIDVDTQPYGLRLIDTNDWTMRTLEPGATDLALGSGALLAYAAAYDKQFRPVAGIGLTAYTVDGAKLFHALGESPLFWARIVGPKVYVAPNGTIVGIDLRTGETVQKLDGPLPEIVS